MSRARFDRLDPTRRDAILDAAAARFAQSGYAEASYNQILDDAGLSKSSAYYLLEGKADLYTAVMRRELERLVATVPVPSPPVDVDSYWAATRGWLRSLLTYFSARPRSAALVAHYASGTGGAPDLDPAIAAALLGPVDALIAVGQGVGAARTDVEPALLGPLVNGALAALDRHYLPALMPDLEPARVEAALDRYVDTLRRLLTP